MGKQGLTCWYIASFVNGIKGQREEGEIIESLEGQMCSLVLYPLPLEQ